MYPLDGSLHHMSVIDFFELLSFIVTVIALPFAIWVFLREQRKERENEDQEAYQQLSDAYNDFLTLVLANADLRLRTASGSPELDDEQRERQRVIFEMLISLFERAYLLIYDEDMSPKQRRRWHSWDDYMREWCRRDDFHRLLPELLRGEDPEFQAYIGRLAHEEAQAA
jgi:hypothetical protein